MKPPPPGASTDSNAPFHTEVECHRKQSELISPSARQERTLAVNRWVAGSSPARGARFFKGLAPDQALTP